ncbi:Myelin protein zero-like protein 2 [Bagarius yarrelli]|uniref:Myelin protein zero-like protein 2 n=1 Tax=Bagarius yarrelli TaxID=175774 RepID=A0A556TTW0_BAGYA|nr:Myelin protein zero-like protein 2 [Bagarius yarrelli]
MRVYTSGRVQAVNGTDVRLKCTFQSLNPIRRSALTISWSFRPLRPGNEETVFYFHEKPFPPSEGRFQKKVVFVGDVSSSDASILLRDVTFSYNGTFSCQVKNPPDVHGNVGEVHLRVVASDRYSRCGHRGRRAASYRYPGHLCVYTLLGCVKMKKDGESDCAGAKSLGYSVEASCDLHRIVVKPLSEDEKDGERKSLERRELKRFMVGAPEIPFRIVAEKRKDIVRMEG